MSEPVSEFTISIDQVENYRFQVSFDKDHLAPLFMDEPPPLGADSGPNPSRVLASAIGGCLSASLLFCLSKSRIGVESISAAVKVQTMRNENRRLRVGRVEVVLKPELAHQDQTRAKRCLGLFEDFCTVTQSIRDGIEIDVKVEGLDG